MTIHFNSSKIYKNTFKFVLQQAVQANLSLTEHMPSQQRGPYDIFKMDRKKQKP